MLRARDAIPDVLCQDRGMSELSQAYHVEFLKAELEKRKQKNARYSMRAFASFLDIHPSALSRILNGIQEISLPTAQIVLQQLKMSDDEKRLFLASVAEEKRYRASVVLAEAIQIPFEEVGFGADSVLSIAPYYGFAVDKNKKLLSMNENGANWVKAAPHQLIGKCIDELAMPPEFVTGIGSLFESAMTSGRPVRSEVGHQNSEGARCYELAASPVRARSTNEIYALIVAIHDITDRKTAHTQKEALLESEKARRLFAEAAAAQSQALQELSSEFVRVERRSEIAHLTILKLMDTLGAAGGVVFQMSHDHRYLEPIGTHTPRTTWKMGRMSIDHTMPSARCARTKSPVWNEAFDANAIEKNVEEIGLEPGVISITALPLMTHGHLVGVLGLRFRELRSFDETQKRFLETVCNLTAQTLDHIGYARETERACALSDRILHEAPVGILYVDRMFKIVRVNDEFARIARRPLSALLHQSLRKTKIFEELEMTLATVMSEQKPQRDLELRFLDRTLLASFYPIAGAANTADSDVSNEVTGAGVTVVDITNRKKNETRRSKIQQILLSVGHSLNATLGAQETLKRFFKLAIPAFAEVCSVNIINLNEVADFSSLHPFGLEPGDLYTRLREPEAWNLRTEVRATGQGQIRLGAKDSIICVPLVGIDGADGTMTFFSHRENWAFNEDDLAAALEMAASLSFALRKALRLEHEQALGSPI